MMSSSILDPEDMEKFDIHEPEEDYQFFCRKDLPSNRQIFLSVTTILLFIAGFLIAPDSINSGTYNIELEYDGESVIFSVIIDEKITELGAPINMIIINQRGNLEALYFQEYRGEAGSSLIFELKVNYPNDPSLSLNLFSGKISNDDLSHDFIAKEINDNTAIFKFKILKDTRLAVGLLFAISFLWLTELVALAASSLLIPVALVLWDIETANSALSHFSEPIIFLFLAGFLLAEAMKRSGLDVFISYKIFSIIPPNGKILMFSLMLLSAVFSMFMSNTASTAILIPIILQLLKGVKIESIQFKKAVILGIAYAATIGGIGSLIGTPANIIAVELLHQFDPSIDFFSGMVYVWSSGGNNYGTNIFLLSVV